MNLSSHTLVQPGQLLEIVEPFDRNLVRRGLALVRGNTCTLQVNVGLLCDLHCRHCHLEAGPQRREVMTIATMDDVIDYAARVCFETIDITGGAPELMPHIVYFLRGLIKFAKTLIVRTNLVALRETEAAGLMQLYRDIGVALVASFPSTDAVQADSQRGQGVWQKSIEVLQDLNQLGYGHQGSGLELDLVVNPAGAFVPDDQGQAEAAFKQYLQRHDIVFNNLYSFANVPLGRFRAWLERSGSLSGYLKTLAEHFNPAAVEGLMCRSLISISWDGYLYDCDFNLAAGVPYGPSKVHVSSMRGLPAAGVNVTTGNHCYACTAGSGFS